MPKKKVHRSRRVRIYSFCFIDSVVPQNIHESCSNWLYNLWKKLYRHPSLLSPIKKFCIAQQFENIRDQTFSWNWEHFRDQSFSVAGEEGWGILVESHSFKAKPRSISLHQQSTKGGLQKIDYKLAANQWTVYKNPTELYAPRGIRWILSWHKLYHHLSPRKWEMMIDPLRNIRIVLSTEWPEGKFCILANGRCPRGFRRHEGHLKSLYLYSSHSQFVNSAKFGSSSIGCYGSYCGQYGNFIGSLTLITCCK